MPKPTKGARMGGSAAHQKAMLANLATNLFEYGRITTPEARARRLRPVAERLITKARKGDLHNRRQVMRTVSDKSVVHTLFTEIGPRYENRPGGYTRITKIGNRRGDNAPMAVIELVEALTVQQEAVGEAEAATKRTAKDSGATKKTAAKKSAAKKTTAQKTTAKKTAAKKTTAKKTAAESKADEAGAAEAKAEEPKGDEAAAEESKDA